MIRPSIESPPKYRYWYNTSYIQRCHKKKKIPHQKLLWWNIQAIECNTQLCEENFMRDSFFFSFPDHKTSYVVTTATKLKGIFLGLGMIGGVLMVSCLLLQLPCCRSGVTEKISRIGFGTKDADKKLIIS